MATSVTISSQTVPPNFCPITDANWQQLVALLAGSFAGDPNFNYGNATPTPANRGKPWFRLKTDETPDRWYKFAQGAWLSEDHKDFTGKIIIWTGSEADIDTLDDGEAGAVTTISGPMWQKVSQLNARFPLGAGTLPSGAVVNPLDTGGEETHQLTIAEMAAHAHGIPTSGNSVRLVSGGFADLGGGGGSGQAVFQSNGSDTPHNTMPPFCGVLFLVKSARRYYRINA